MCLVLEKSYVGYHVIISLELKAVCILAVAEPKWSEWNFKMQENESYNVGTLTEDTLRKLEASGLRMTVQRRHIIEILTSSQCTSPKELWYEAKQYVPDLGIATVYRLINRLEQIGVLSKNRNIGMQPVTPEIGTLTDGHGRDLKRPGLNLDLTELVRLGLISKGAIGHNNVIQLTLVGDKVNVAVVK